MNLLQIQLSEYIIRQIKPDLNFRLVVKNNDLIFSADFLDYENKKTYNIYMDSQRDESRIEINQTTNNFWKLYIEFVEIHKIIGFNRIPKWTDPTLLREVINFVGTKDPIGYTVEPSKVSVLNQNLKFILIEPDDELTIIGMQ